MIIPVLLFVAVVSIGGALFVNAQEETALLKKFNLSKISVEEMVEQLEGVEDGLLQATINTKYITLSDGENTAKVKMPEDKFFLAFAPYINKSEPCSEYNLLMCQGELANQTFQVLITSPNGDVLVDQEMISANNGFITIWLDKDIEANLVVTYNNLKATAFITTFKDSQTCITTTLQLTK